MMLRLEFISERFHFSKLFQLLFVSLPSMPTTDHDLCIRKVLCHCILRGGVSILPMNSNVYVFLLCFLECEACSITFHSLGCSLIEFLIYQIISTFLAEMLSIKKSSSVIIANTECKILAVMTTCHPRTISSPLHPCVAHIRMLFNCFLNFIELGQVHKTKFLWYINGLYVTTTSK